MKIKKLNNKLFIIAFVLIVFGSCGLRESGNSYTNPLIETWKLSELKCYNPDYNSGVRLERYVLNSSLNVEMKFTGRNFTYAVTETDEAVNCITSASGSYGLNYISGTEGKINYDDFNLSTGCNVGINESSGGSTVEVPFGLSALSDDATNLEWIIDEEGILVLEVSTGFKGSDTSSLCAENCKCYGFFSKKSN